MISLSSLTKKPKSPLTNKQLEQLKIWLKEDWEANDIGRDVKIVLQRLLLNIKEMENQGELWEKSFMKLLSK